MGWPTLTMCAEPIVLNANTPVITPIKPNDLQVLVEGDKALTLNEVLSATNQFKQTDQVGPIQSTKVYWLSFEIKNNVATAILVYPIPYTGVQFIGNLSDFKEKFEQENPNNILTKENIKFNFVKNEHYNVLTVEYYIPITIHENGIDEDDEAEVVDRLIMIEDFHEKIGRAHV